MKAKQVKALVLQAIQASKYKWRTARGISKDTGISLQQVIDFLEASPAILRSKKANSQGQPLYALRESHRGETEEEGQDLVSSESMRSKETQLHSLLLSLFGYDELQYLIGLLPNDRRICAELDFSRPLYVVVHELVDALSRRGAIDSDFFEILLSLRPHEAETIRSVWAKWEPQPEEWSQPPRTRKSDDLARISLDRQKEHVAGHVFVSYSRRDSTFFEELRTHLTLLVRQNFIDIWDEGRILAGEGWARRVESTIQESDIFVLLVSPDFLASEYSSRFELELIFRQAPAGAQIIPVLVRPVTISEEHRLRHLQWLPKNNIPISEQEDTDEAWLEVSDAIRLAAQRVRR